MTNLALLASRIQSEMAPHQHDHWDKVDTLSADLDRWSYRLPPDLHLSGLNDRETRITALQKKAVYLMHILHIDMRLQLYCQLVKKLSIYEGETGFLTFENLFSQLLRHIFDNHTIFSIQMARILWLLYNREAIMTRCWLVMCVHSYHANPSLAANAYQMCKCN